METESVENIELVFAGKEKKRNKLIIIGFIMIIIFCVTLFFLFVPPFGFADKNPNGVYVNVKSGMGVRQVSHLLYDSGVISSSSVFVALASILGHENGIASGVYLFTSSKSIWDAENIITNGEYGIQSKKITFPEGFTNKQIAERLEANLPEFDKSKFMNLASTSEGYLYPETYFFLPSDGEEVIFKKMRTTFDEKTAEFKTDFDSSSRSEQDVVILASIIEREVKTLKDKKLVADILLSRMKIGMALQVDATLAYERNKDSYTLTTADLRADSPYNTYTRRGLPPTAISNPGIDSIDAALHPVENPYIYFLTDREGNVYYATTYEEHLKYKAKYL